ncbi:DUF6221 family protein [Streptomyces sp. CA-106110]|uniref:DUF6221 family protein n=1 Tax=Streptomyces sp. CA-106110 TaxID=3240044 RepID=UPI003D932EF4
MSKLWARREAWLSSRNARKQQTYDAAAVAAFVRDHVDRPAVERRRAYQRRVGVMDDLIQWMRVQLDEDERFARAATEGPWFLRDESIIGADGTEVVAGGRLGGEASVFESTADALHIVVHDPVRVLREVDAKRRLLYEFDRRANHVRRTELPATGGVWDDLLRMLALPYVDRPGYRDEWRPRPAGAGAGGETTRCGSDRRGG